LSRSRKSPLHLPAIHESGHRHASGQALYVDDLPPPRGLLVAHVVASPVARGRIQKLEVRAAGEVPGVAAVITAADIPGVNDISPVAHDEPLLATNEVHTVGQAVALVLGDSYEACRAAAARVVLEIEPLPAIVDLRQAVAARSFMTEPHVMQRGDVKAALASAPVRVQGEILTGGQDHFYLETQAALALPIENGSFRVFSSTQHPSEVQAKIAEILALGRHQVVVECTRMGGGFGGKETQAAHYAALAALGSWKTGRPVKVWLNRDQDMVMTGKRHPFFSRFDAGFDRDGRLLALSVETFSDGGWSRDLSQAITDRCLFHLDNSYYIPTLRFEGRVARTNLASNTAFRGFGGPQGMAVIEEVMNLGAERLGMDAAELRRRNFYGAAPRNRTPYDQEVTDSRIERIWSELSRSSEYTKRREEIASFNSGSRFVKRGIGFQPVKFGISFTNSMLNQAGALVLLYGDGTVQLNHGGTEMGQGLHTKMLAICAHELGVSLDRIRMMDTATDKVPNTSATAASSGSDLNGQAIKDACAILRERLRPVAAKLLELPPEEAYRVVFEENEAHVEGDVTRSVPFSSVTSAGYVAQVSMAATGYYRTPDIHYDRSVGRGKPFHYFAYGGAVIETEVNGLTGEHRLRRVDILHDVGDSLVPTIDRGQVEGGFIQGYGWLTCEELVWDAQGNLRTHSPDTYKVPAVGEAPLDFRVELLDDAAQANVIHGSKAVGEPPLMLAIGAVTALRHAIRAFAESDERAAALELRYPCTPEAVLRAIYSVRGEAKLHEAKEASAEPSLMRERTAEPRR
jgi:xanthine dehydrogenase large subunit